MFNLCILPTDPSSLCLSIPDFLRTLPPDLLSSLVIQPSPSASTTALLWLPNIAQGDTSCALRDVLRECPRIRLVQLPMTGVEHFVPLMRERGDVVWCCGKGCYSEVVAEHGLAMALTLLRDLHRLGGEVGEAGEAGESSESGESGGSGESGESGGNDTLIGKKVLIVGNGSIACSLAALLAPFNCTITTTDSTTPIAILSDTLLTTDVLFLACPLTPHTHHLFSQPLLSLLPPHSLIINIARAQLIHTPSLLSLLLSSSHTRAALDVIDTSDVNPNLLNRLIRQRKLLLTHHQAVPNTLIPALLGDRLRWNLQVLVGKKKGWKGRVDLEKGY